MPSYKSVMHEANPKLNLDKKLTTAVHTYAQLFVNRNDDHIRFFGGNLLGVNNIVYKSSDKYEWLELLDIDEDSTKNNIKKIPAILNDDWIRYTDVVNVSCLYLLHLLHNSDMKADVKESAMIDVLMILQFKFFSSILSHYFKYPANEASALATYAALSKKYAIKQQGNWYSVFVNRSKNIIAENSIHYETIARFDDDGAIMYMISDIQGRLKEMVKKIWDVFAAVRSQDVRIMSSGGSIVLDGKTMVKDVSRQYTPYRRYIGEIILERPRFIKPELIEVIGSAMFTMPEKVLLDTLNYIVDNNKDQRVQHLIDETLLHAFDYLSNDRRAASKMDDIGGLITKLRALYMASRSSDPTLLKMRSLGEALVLSSVKGRSAAVVSSVRTGLLLYIVLRTFAMKHYG